MTPVYRFDGKVVRPPKPPDQKVRRMERLRCAEWQHSSAQHERKTATNKLGPTNHGARAQLIEGLHVVAVRTQRGEERESERSVRV